MDPVQGDCETFPLNEYQAYTGDISSFSRCEHDHRMRMSGLRAARGACIRAGLGCPRYSAMKSL